MDAKQIKEFRKSLKLTQEQFAHMLGVTVTSVNNWETGRRKPSPIVQKLLHEVIVNKELQR